MDAGSIWVNIGAKVDSLVNGVNASKKEIAGLGEAAKGTNKDLISMGSDMKTLTIPLAAVAAATYALSQKYGGMAQELKDLSVQTGVSTDKLQDLKFAATLSGTEFGKVSSALNLLTLKMGEAADEASPAYAAFMGLGIDPKGRTPDEVFDDLALALNSIEDPAKKAAAAQEIFGKNYKDMLPYMEDYIKNQEEIKRNSKYTEEELAQLDDLKVGWDKLGESIDVVQGKFFALIYSVQQNMNKLNPLYRLMYGGDLSGFAESVIDAATLGKYSELQDATTQQNINKKPYISSPTIIINNPSGTPADVAAAVQQASRDLARDL
jgi:hypothetical protein